MNKAGAGEAPTAAAEGAAASASHGQGQSGASAAGAHVSTTEISAATRQPPEMYKFVKRTVELDGGQWEIHVEATLDGKTVGQAVVLSCENQIDLADLRGWREKNGKFKAQLGDDCAYLLTITVFKGHRGKGAGRMFLKYLLSLLLEKKKKWLWLEDGSLGNGWPVYQEARDAGVLLHTLRGKYSENDPEYADIETWFVALGGTPGSVE